MKKFLVFLTLLAVILGIAIVMRPKSITQIKPKEAVPTETVQTFVNEPQKTGEKGLMGQYYTYSKYMFESTTASKRVLFFYSASCGACTNADKNFQETSAKWPGNLIVIRVNFDKDNSADEKKLVNTYSATAAGEFVQIDSKGAVVKRWTGGDSTQLLQNVK